MQWMVFLVATVLSCKGFLFADYGIAVKRTSDMPIIRFHVYGERCSGTNYTHELICQNSNLTALTWGHKHSPPWYELPQSEWHGSDIIYNFKNCDQFLFIIVVRDPYEWTGSMNLTPHGADRSLYQLPLSEFIRRVWIVDDNFDWVKGEKLINPLLDKDPYTGEPFANIFKLRSAKINAMLQILQRAPNAYLVRYEDVRDDPQGVLKELAHCFGVTLKEEFKPIDKYKGCSYWWIYEPKKYSEFSAEDIAFANSQLDEALENSLGYALRQPQDAQTPDS